jgi:hypothetical protein
MAVLDWVEKWVRKSGFQQKEVCRLSDLASIQDSSVNMVYWKRPIDEDIELFVRFILQEGFSPLNQVVNRNNVQAIVSDHLSKVRFYSVGKASLEADVVRITHQFMDTVKADRLRLILKVVQDDACRKFHTDAYDLRLLCTYFGQGTEWLADQFVNRGKLIKGTNDDIVRDWSQVQRTAPFEVAILKGEPAFRPKGGIVHRSPTIERTDEKRFLFRLDY